MIATAPSNIAIQTAQNKMNKIHLNLTQNGSFAYFINSSFVIPVNVFVSKRGKKEENFVRFFSLSNVLSDEISEKDYESFEDEIELVWDDRKD